MWPARLLHEKKKKEKIQLIPQNILEQNPWMSNSVTIIRKQDPDVQLIYTLGESEALESVENWNIKKDPHGINNKPLLSFSRCL